MQIIELDIIAVKGKKEGVRIYTLLENNLSESQHNIVVTGHVAFLNDYRMQRWNGAISHAKELMNQNKEMKKYYEMMVERIMELRVSNLDKDWDGVFRATSK